MAARGNDGLIQEVKVMLRSVLVSSKGGVDENFLLKEYQELTGDQLPYRRLGFQNLYEMAMAFSDVMRVSRLPDGSLKYLAVADASTAHIQKMVSQQRSSRRKPKKNKNFNMMRRPTKQSSWVRNTSARPSVFSHHSPAYRGRPARRSPPPWKNPAPQSAPHARNFQPPPWKNESRFSIPKTNSEPSLSPKRTFSTNNSSIQVTWQPRGDAESWDDRKSPDRPPVTTNTSGRSSYNRGKSSANTDMMNLQVTSTPGGTRHVDTTPSLTANQSIFQENLPPRFQAKSVPATARAQSPLHKPRPVPAAATPPPVVTPPPVATPPAAATPVAVTPAAATPPPAFRGESPAALSTPKPRPVSNTPLQDARKKANDMLDYPKLLEDYMRQHNIKEEYMTGPAGRGLKGKKMGFVSSITINGQCYGSLGIFSSKERAEFFAAKTAWEEMNAHKVTEDSNRGLSNSVDEEDVKRNVAVLLNEKPNGIFENNVPEEYRKKWNENPPRNMMDLLVKWTDIASVEEVSGVGRKIVYPSSTLMFSHYITGKKEEKKKNEDGKKEKADVEKRDHIPEADLPSIGSTVVAVICFVIDCEAFFVHLVENTMINDIMVKMDDIYVKKVKGEPPKFSDTKKLESMKYCAALYEGQWYRAQALTDPVPNRNFEDEVKICFIDFGNVESEVVTKARLLSKSMYGYPAQAIRCSLYGVGKRDDNTWNTATMQLQMLEQGVTQVSMTIKGVKDDVCLVELYNDTHKGRSVNEMLIKAKLVRDTLKVRASEPDPLVIPDVPAGETMDVFVSHIYSASNIILRLLCYSDKLTELEKLIQDNNLGMGQDDLEVNDLCAAIDRESLEENSDDNPWFRVRILEVINKEKVKAEYLDYGGTAELEVKNLRLLTAEENLLPYQAFRARLTALEGCEGEDVTEKLKSVCESRPCLAEINSRDPVSVTLWDTATAEDVNINEFILEVLNQDELRPKVPPHMGDAECFAVHVTSSGTVFVHINGPGMQTLEQLMKQVTETIAKTEDQLTLGNVEPDVICLTFVSDQWYRAKILEVFPDDRVKVFLVDYGMETEAIASELLDLDKCSMKFSHLPHQAVEVHLDGTPSVWTEKALETLEELVRDQTLYIETIEESTEGSLPSVELYVFSNGELNSVREALMKNSSLWEGVKDLSHLMDDLQLDNRTNPDLTNNNSTEKLITQEDIANYMPRLPGEGSTAEMSNGAKEMAMNLRELPRSGDEIYITSAASPSNFQFIAEKDRPELKNLMERMARYYQNKIDSGSDVASVAQGDVLAAHNPEDGYTYRAQVKKVLSTDQLSVCLLDYGDHNVVARSHIFQLIPEFSEIPPFAMSATLIGISPAQGMVWSTAATQRFEELAFEKTLEVWAPQPVAWVGNKVALTLMTEKDETKDKAFVHQILLAEELAVKTSSRRNSETAEPQ